MKKIFSLVAGLFIICSGHAAIIQPINTTTAPKPLGPYSQAMQVDLQQGKLIFVAGQIPMDPKTQQLQEATIEQATRQTLHNIAAILKAAGSDLDHVVRVDIFLRDFNDWEGMNKEYVKYFSNGVYPARQAIPANIKNRIEISCIAVVPNR